MSVKKKSNWYIYIITFVITFVLLGLVVKALWSVMFPEKDTSAMGGTSDFRPDESVQITCLAMLSETKAGVPEYYMALNYRPRDEVIICVPLKGNMIVSSGKYEGSIKEIYNAAGAAEVVKGVNNTLGIECSNYFKFDKNSFTEFVDLTGDVYVNVPNELSFGGTVMFEAGSQYLTGVELYSYMTFADYGKGDDYRSAVHGSLIMNLLNQNFRNLTTTQLQTFATKILNTTETDFIFQDYTDNQSSFIYTTTTSVNPAEYYIPYGDTDDNGYFRISENSAATIRDRFNITAATE